MRDRPAHDQRLSVVDREPARRVEGVQFIATVDTGQIKFDRYGNLVVTLTVPKDFAERGLEVRFLAGVPLSVDVQRWRAAPDPPGVPPPPPLEDGRPDHPANPAFRRERNGG
jgi:hypothetical protein